MSYQWDIFISYRRVPLISHWTHKVFVPTLRSWLPQFHTPTPRVFIDIDDDPTFAGIDPGAAWATSLETALQRSRCLLPILSGEYFESEWCVAEFQTMFARQTHTGATLILPIRFADGDFYSAEAKTLQIVDFQRFNAYRRQGQISQLFIKEVQKLCRLLQARLGSAPEWDQAWPVVRPVGIESSHVPKPTF